MNVSWNHVLETARDLGALVNNGMNWSWAVFGLGENAEAGARLFAEWCTEHGIETRGISPPTVTRTNPDINTWAVRFR